MDQPKLQLKTIMLKYFFKILIIIFYYTPKVVVKKDGKFWISFKSSITNFFLHVLIHLDSNDSLSSSKNLYNQQKHFLADGLRGHSQSTLS